MASTLAIDICQADNCKSFTVEDETGIYHATTKLGGYGAPNFLTTDVTAATVAVTLLGASTTYTTSAYSTLPNTAGTTFTINNTDIGLASTATIPDGIYLIRYTVSGTIAITAVSTGSKQFTVSGNRSGVYVVGDTFTITGSTGNNGTYTVVSITYSAPNTLIVVSETVPSAVADGVVTFSEYTSVYEMFFCNGEACLHTQLQEVQATDCKDCNDARILTIAKINTIKLAAQYAARCGKANKAQALLDYLTELCSLTSCSNCS